MPLSRLSSPFLSGVNRVTLHMLHLLLALVPAVIALVYFFGPSVLITITLAVVVAISAETLMLKLRNRPIKAFLLDGSAVVTAVLLAIALPPLAPWWLTTVGILFAIIFAKHLYGGLGYNPFNPAMIAYVLLLVSFPLEMTRWLPVVGLNEQALDFTSTFQVIFSGQLASGIDTMSGATPLDAMKTQIGLSKSPSLILQQSLFNGFAGQGWMWLNIWFALGGLYLINRRVISWHIPTAMLAGLASISLVTWLVSPETTASPIFHLLNGGTMLGAFFIATDPVTAATTIKGRLVFGAGVGLLTYIIRIWGGYPDGIAFAIIIMNMLVPLIDYYTQPRVYGAANK
jgi:electron transport complex protein RnfD